MKPYNIGNTSKNVIIKYKNNLKIGKGSTYNDYCYFNARFGIYIGENTLLGPNIIIQTSNHVIKNLDIEQNANDKNSWCSNDPKRRIIGERISIGNDIWIGAGVIILAGATIPDKCIIGAGTIITKSNSKKLKIGDIAINDVKLKILKNRRDYV